MASCPVQFKASSGLTLTLKLFPYGSDAIANGSGNSATEKTNCKGLYQATVTAGLTGWHDALVVDGSANVIANYAVYMEDDTTIKRCHDAADRLLPVLAGAIPPVMIGSANGLARSSDGSAITVASGIVSANAIKLDGQTPVQTLGKLWVLDTDGNATPTASQNAAATRTNLATELGRIDVAVSTRATPTQVASSILVTPAQKIVTDIDGKVTTSNPAITIVVQQAPPVPVTEP